MVIFLPESTMYNDLRSHILVFYHFRVNSTRIDANLTLDIFYTYISMVYANESIYQKTSFRRALDVPTTSQVCLLRVTSIPKEWRREPSKLVVRQTQKVCFSLTIGSPSSKYLRRSTHLVRSNSYLRIYRKFRRSWFHCHFSNSTASNLFYVTIAIPCKFVIGTKRTTATIKQRSSLFLSFVYAWDSFQLTVWEPKH